MYRPVAIAVVAVSALLSGCEAPAAESGVILMYHHVSDDTPPSTSVTPAAFAEQLDFLERENFTIVPLEELLDALRSGRPVAERSVALTFDDGYISVLTEAAPLLAARGWPFTVFVNTGAIDGGYGGYLNWDQLRQLGAQGASIGNHSVTHTHLVRRAGNESSSDWRRRVNGEVSLAAERLQAEVGEFQIPVFAYPYGEYTTEVKDIVASHELYGLGQQSGAVGSGSDFVALPRYPIAVGLEMAEFALRVRSRPLPARPVGDEQHIVTDANDRPELRLALDANDDIRLDELACYATGQGVMSLQWQGGDRRQFTVRPESPFGPGRSKVNCTAPSQSTSGVYYWYGHLWMRRLADGSWYDQ